MTHLQIGDYVRHKKLTENEYMAFCEQAKAAGFDLSLGHPVRRYREWGLTVLTKSYKQSGTTNSELPDQRCDVTHHFKTQDPNVDGPLRNSLIAQGWVPPSVTPKEQWLADAVEETNCETLSAEVLYDALKSGRLPTP